MTSGQRCVTFLVVLAALLLRVWALDFKPAHFDEGVNGSFIDGMAASGAYEYNPSNYHGPLHFYVLFAAQQLFGRSLWVLRMPTVLIGTAAVALIFAFRRWMPFRAAALAALAAALSPALIFYSRYAIHEMWLPFFTLLAAYGGWGLAIDRRPRDVWWLGLGLAGMVLTKETYLFHWIAAALSMLWIALFSFLFDRRSAALPETGERPNAIALFSSRRLLEAAPAENRPPANPWFAVLACLGIAVAFYSSFGLHWKGVSGLWETWRFMLEKGYSTDPNLTDSGHHKDFSAYLRLLLYYEWPAVAGLALSLVLAFWFEKNRADLLAVRFLALFGLGSFMAYSLIPYKTPWCIITVLPPLFLVLGWFGNRLLEMLGKGAAEAAVGGVFWAMLLAHPAIKSVKLNFIHPTNDDDHTGNGRYAYVQTTHAINRLLHPVRALIAQDPSNRYLFGQVFAEKYPLQWELGDMPFVYFPEENERIESYDADFLMLPAGLVAEFEAHLRGVYFKEEVFIARGYGAPCWLYFGAERFASLFPGREPEFHPRIPLHMEGEEEPQP